MAGFKWRRLAVALVSAWPLAGCGAAYDPQGFWNSATFWQEGAASDQALAELSKGNFQAAEHFSKEAMRRNPQDPYALLAAAIVYQNTNRPELARQYYQSILSLGPKAVVTIGGNSPYATRSVADVARANLEQLMPLPQVDVDPSARQEGMNLAVATRFVTLKRLYDEHMITEEEFRSRRAANIGALLPYTGSPAAAGLDRPAPSSDQVIERLQALNRSLEIKAITPREHADERNAILEALMPPAPRTFAKSPPLPKDAAQAAEASAWLDKYRAMKLITPEEAAREADAITKAIHVATAPLVTATPLAPVTPPPAIRSSGAGVHLASLASEAAAQKEWASLQSKLPQLRGLQPVISRADLGKKGVYYRLKAGPVASKAAAVKLCKELKAKKLFCQSTSLDGK